MGSCFAVEIRNALRQSGIRLLPDYQQLSLDPYKETVGGLPQRENLNYYHTFAIRQQFENAFEHWEPDPNDYWEVTRRHPETQQEIISYQDPYQRLLFADSPERLNDLRKRLNQVIREGVLNATAYIITLGLVEVWQNKKSGKYACMNPGYGNGGGHKETSFHASGYEENYQNMKAVIEMIQAHNPSANIFLTVSPVPLGSTFKDEDVLFANIESKSILRVVAGTLAREYSMVQYFPAYDICSNVASSQIFEPDGRHVQRHIVEKIVQTFLHAYVKR